MIKFKSCLRIICMIVFLLPTCILGNDIFTAIEQGNLEAVKVLVQENTRLVTSVDNQGYTPLHKAAYNNHPDIVEYLISQGADINAASGSGSTPLHGAAYYGHPEIVDLLLEHEAALELANASGYTPLLSACAGNQSEIVRLLVEKGADINSSSGGGSTPLFQAVWNDDVELTKFLLERGAEVNIQTNLGVSLPFFATAFRGSELCLMLSLKASNFNEKDEFGLSMLHYSAARGFTELVQMLLDNDVEVNCMDSLGRTPFFYAALWGYNKVADILKAHGGTAPNLEQTWFEGDHLGRSKPRKTPAEFVGDELRTPFSPHGQIAFSPDGKEMLWCHQAMPIQAMWYSRQVNGIWQKPIIAPFTNPALNYADGNPCFSADGKRVYFHTQHPLVESNDPRDDTDIWYVEKSGENWGNPLPLEGPVNTTKNDLSPVVAPSGNLYFIGSEYEDSFGTDDIYISEFVNGVYTIPRNLGPAINSEKHELSPIVSADESYMIFASDRPNPYSRNLQLYVSFKYKGEWTNAVNLGRTINRGHTWHPFLTADNKYLFYQQGTSYFWLSTDLIDDIKIAMHGTGQVDTDMRLPVFRKSDQLFEHTATNDIALGDFDSDGDLDAVFSNMHNNDSRVYLNNGQGKFMATEQPLTQEGHGIDLGDIDADGDLDIVITCADYGRDLMVYLNDSKANFILSPQNLGDSLLAGNNVNLYDIDSDGDLDAIVVYYQQDDLIYLNDGHGQFSRSDLTSPEGSNWADLDSDGDVDIFLREVGVGFKTLLNDGTGNFSEHWSKSDSNIYRGGVGFGDIDEDGDTDVIVAFHDQSEHRFSTLWYNDGSGRFHESDVRLPLTRHAKMSIGDLNGDSHPDVFLNNLGFPSAVWLNDGRGRLFDSGIRLPGVWQNTVCPLGDLDCDGDLDVFISAFGSGPNEIWFNEQ